MNIQYLFLTATLVFPLMFSACSPIESTPLSEPQPSLPPPEHTDTSNPTIEPTDLPTLTQVPTETPTAIPKGVELVNLKTPGNIDLVGYLHRPEKPLDDKLAVVLAHGHTSSHAEWAGLEKILVENGITTMTFDFRGHGSSGGIDRFSTNGIDVQTVFKYLQQIDFERIICIGSSMGGSACLDGATKVDINGLVMLSSEMNTSAKLVSNDEYQALKIPKIFMFTENDVLAIPYYGSTVEGYRQTAELAVEPKEVYVFPGTAHGSVMLQSENGEKVIEILLNFVKDLAQ